MTVFHELMHRFDSDGDCGGQKHNADAGEYANGYPLSRSSKPAIGTPYFGGTSIMEKADINNRINQCNYDWLIEALE